MLTNTPQRSGSGAGSGTADAWDEIERLVREVAELARADVDTLDFYQGVLDRAVRALSAAGGVVWRIDDDAGSNILCQIRLKDVLPSDPHNERQHQVLLAGVCSGQDVRLVPPSSGSTTERGGNPSDYAALICPVLVNDAPVAGLELFLRPGSSPAAQQGFLQFLAALGELCAEFERNRELRLLRDREAVWQQFEEFTQRVHTALSTRQLAFTVVNEGRRVIQCDRLTLATKVGERFRLQAVSGLDTLDQRANVVQRLEELTRVACATGEPFWHTEPSPVLSPQMETALTNYLPASRARMLAVLPLKGEATATTPAPILGALIVERFESGRADDAFRQRIAAVTRQTGLALRNTHEHESIPFVSLLRLLRVPMQALKTRKAALIGCGLALLGILAWLIPYEFEVSGQGELQPAMRRNLFAPSDGVVDELKVRPAQQVAKGEVLAVLQSTELDFELSRVLGEKLTVEKRLASIEAARLGGPGETDITKLAAEQEELQIQRKSLLEQQEILKKQQAELSVRSPMAGYVLTWDLDRELLTRPVQRGDLLLTVASLEGDWQLEMQVPDYDIGHVLNAGKKGPIGLPVNFLLASDPGVVYHGTVEKVANAAEVHGTAGPAVQVVVKVKDTVGTAFRPGAKVIPKIQCGQKSIGYVWLHDVIDAVRTRLLF